MIFSTAFSFKLNLLSFVKIVMHILFLLALTQKLLVFQSIPQSNIISFTKSMHLGVTFCVSLICKLYANW